MASHQFGSMMLSGKGTKGAKKGTNGFNNGFGLAMEAPTINVVAPPSAGDDISMSRAKNEDKAKS